MNFTLLQTKKNQHQIYDKRTILFNQDVFLETHLKECSIKKMILFVLRDSAFEVAHWKGFNETELSGLSFSYDGIFVDQLRESGSIISLKDVEKNYNDSVFFSTLQNKVIKRERDLFAKIGCNYILPVNVGRELCGFVVVKSKNKQLDKTISSEFLKVIQVWGESYYDLQIQRESSNAIGEYKKFMQFVSLLAMSDEIDDMKEALLAYVLKLMTSSKGMLLTLKNKYYVPDVNVGVNSLKSYRKSELKEIMKSGRYIVSKSKDVGANEFGLGRIRAININNKTIMLIKETLAKGANEELVNAAVVLVGKMISCQSTSKKQK